MKCYSINFDNCFSGFNTDVALRKAKDNVEKHYTVVGVLEDFNKTLSVFEHYIPKIFKGSMNIYRSRNNNNGRPEKFKCSNICL